MTKLERQKKNPRSKYWRTKADKEITRIFRGTRCLICGNPNCCGHHLISRSHGCTRHDLRCLVPVCAKHHTFDHTLSAHGAPMAFAQWLEEEHPAIYEWVAENKWRTDKPNYQEAYEALREIETWNYGEIWSAE